MVAGRSEKKGVGSSCLLGIEFQFEIKKKVLEVDRGDGCTMI